MERIVEQLRRAGQLDGVHRIAAGEFVDPLEHEVKDRGLRRERLAERALERFQAWMAEEGIQGMSPADLAAPGALDPASGARAREELGALGG